MADEVILAKIKKLLNLATSDNANEAANAQAAAQKLLLRHHIDEAELNEFSLTKTEKITQITTSGKNGHNRSTWYNTMAGIIAKANLCEMLTSGPGLIWIGKPTDIEISQFLLSQVVSDLTRICERDWYNFNWEQRNASRYMKVHGKSWKNSFYLGACQSIRDRLNENLLQLKAADNETNALILRNDIELKEYLHSNFSIRYTQTRGASDRSGFDSGKAAGRSLQFRGGITSGGSQSQKLLTRG